MRMIFALIGSFAAGGVGGWLGDLYGPVSGFLLGTVASGFGFYYGRRLFDEWLN